MKELGNYYDEVRYNILEERSAKRREKQMTENCKNCDECYNKIRMTAIEDDVIVYKKGRIKCDKLLNNYNNPDFTFTCVYWTIYIAEDTRVRDAQEALDNYQER